MENSIIQRIKSVIEYYDMSVTALSKKIGVVQQTLNRQISGDGAMSLSTIDKILSCFPEISAEWLMRGEGSMIKGESNVSNEIKRKIEFTVFADEEGYLKIRE